MIAVAMSGGLDSSMVAALTQERGHSVVGLTMRLWREGSASDNKDDGVRDARSVCEFLGIPHHVVDMREAFLREVVDYFCAEYAAGRTPNPCIRCNRELKLGKLLSYALDLGCDTLATGHYCRIAREGDEYRLLCGVDATKDQSYFLYMLQQHQLARLTFPLGNHFKAGLRERAQALGLPVAHRPESQDVCFVMDGDYRRFLRQHQPDAVRPGPIYDSGGRHLGEHQGLPFYTIGQRGGLGISAPEPLYVMRLDPERNALIVGPAHELGRRVLLAEEMSLVSGGTLDPGTLLDCKIRYRAKRARARVWILEEKTAKIVFEQPLRDITPGQAVVLYQRERVVGGGIITRSLSRT